MHPKPRRWRSTAARELLWLREPFLSARDWQQPFVVVHGHTIRGPEVHPHRIAIDSGAYRTGVLTALQLADDRLRFWCVGSDPKRKAFRRLPGLEQARRFTARAAPWRLPPQADLARFQLRLGPAATARVEVLTRIPQMPQLVADPLR